MCAPATSGIGRAASSGVPPPSCARGPPTRWPRCSAWCSAAGVAVVPQGGNTGLVGGSVPDGSGTAIVLSLRRLDALGAGDADAGQLTAGAGVTLSQVHAAAAGCGWSFGVDLGARETATIGGMVGTNAGGLHVVRHGAMRAQVLGVEAVLASGAVVRHVDGLVKDNTGYDLAGLLTGSEGTLGVVTAARLRLVATGRQCRHRAHRVRHRRRRRRPGRRGPADPRRRGGHRGDVAPGARARGTPPRRGLPGGTAARRRRGPRGDRRRRDTGRGSGRPGRRSGGGGRDRVRAPDAALAAPGADHRGCRAGRHPAQARRHAAAGPPGPVQHAGRRGGRHRRRPTCSATSATGTST